MELVESQTLCLVLGLRSTIFICLQILPLFSLSYSAHATTFRPEYKLVSQGTEGQYINRSISVRENTKVLGA